MSSRPSVAGLLLALALAAAPAPLLAQEEDLGNPEKAIKKFSEAVKKAPEDAASWHNLALANYRAKKHDEAAKAVTEAIRLNPASAASKQLAGAIAMKRGRTSEAIASYEAALALETEGGADATFDTVHGLAGAYFETERWDDAIKQYKAARKLVAAGAKGDESALNNQIGVSYLRKGDATEAVSWFERTVKEGGDNPAAQYNLGQTYRKIALSNPAEGAPLWAKAAEAFKIAADAAPNDVFYQFFAGDAMAMSGRKAEAVKYLDRYLAADPDGKKAVAKFGAAAGADVLQTAKELKAECLK